jgi:hypothetical protein
MSVPGVRTIPAAGKVAGLVFLAAVLGAAVPRAQEIGVRTVVAQLRAPLEITNIKGAPYSAQVVVESTQALADGNRIVQRSTGRVYRDSEGRVRREEDRTIGGPSVSIVDPVAGVSFALDVINRVAWKTPMPVTMAMIKKLGAVAEHHERIDVEIHTQRAEIAAAKIAGRPLIEPAGGGEHRDEQLPEQILEGVRATGHRRTTIIAAGAIGNELPITIISEEWTSPDLQVLVMTHRTDPRTGESSYRLQNIVRAEPDAYLFQVPADFSIKETGIQKMEFER